MDKDKFIERITEANNVNFAKLFFVLKNNGSFEIKSADIENGDTQSALNKMFNDMVSNDIISNSNLELCSLTKDAEKEDGVYLYDHQETLFALDFLVNFETQSENDAGGDVRYDPFNFKTDNISNLFGFIVQLGSQENNFLVFQKFYSMLRIKREALLLGGIHKSQTRLQKVGVSDIIRLSGKINLIYLDEEIYVFDIKLLQKEFGYSKILEKDVKHLLSRVEALNILEDMEPFTELTADEVFLRKLARVSRESAIFEKNITRETMMDFLKENNVLSSRFKYTQDNKQIRLDTLKSKKDFLKLLQDDFLTSKLTNVSYEANSKDRLK